MKTNTHHEINAAKDVYEERSEISFNELIREAAMNIYKTADRLNP